MQAIFRLASLTIVLLAAGNVSFAESDSSDASVQKAVLVTGASTGLNRGLGRGNPLVNPEVGKRVVIRGCSAFEIVVAAAIVAALEIDELRLTELAISKRIFFTSVFIDAS